MTSPRRPTQDKLDDLLAAAKEGNTKRLEYLIQEKKLPVDTCDPSHWNRTLFLISCKHGQLAAMEKLLQLGADINASDELGCNAMHLAAANGQEGVLQWLLQKHPDMIKQTNNDRWNAMHLAAANGQEGVLQWLLQKYPDMIKQTNNNGSNAMHLAAFNGHERLADLILQKHPDMIKQTTNDGSNAMHLAAMMGHERLVDLILQKHPDMIKQTDNDGSNAMHLAAMMGHERLVDLILQKHPDMIKQTDNDGDTPLDYAVIYSKPSVVWTMVQVHKVDITHCKEEWREDAKSLLAAEEARRAKSKNTSSSNEGDTNASTQGNSVDDDEDMKMAYSLALRDGEAYSRDLQILLVGAENTGKTCIISSFLDEQFIENQEATKGADTNICKIYCTNWRRLSHSDIIVHLHHQFITLYSTVAQKKFHFESRKLKYTENVLSNVKVHQQQLPEPHPQDIHDVSTHTVKYDTESLNAVVWDFAGQVIFHNTHSVFISENGVIVITFNAAMKLSDKVVPRKGSHILPECYTSISSIHYWLKVVESMCSVKGNKDDLSPILPTALLAGTHIDYLHHDIKQARKIAKERILPQLEEELFKKPYSQHIAGISNGIKAALEEFCFFVSNKYRDEEFDRLKVAAVNAASSLRKHQPLYFLKIERSLLQQKEHVISKSAMLDIVAKCSFPIAENSLEFKGILKHFHIKRTILHFYHIESLKNLVILSPHWLAKLFSYVITADSYCKGVHHQLDEAWEQLTKYGILHESLLSHMLDKFHLEYPSVVHVTKEQVVDILLCFHLVAKITREAWFVEKGYPCIPDSGDTFIVPSLTIHDERKMIPSTAKEKIVYYRFDNAFIPTSFLNQLIADCICRNVEKNDQLLWLRHGKVGLKLGTHQKYYISQCDEKQSVQLTITTADNNLSCALERRQLIKDISLLLDNIMKMFMPAARRPTVFVPCCKCTNLHIRLDEVYAGSTIFCSAFDNDLQLPLDYYSELLGPPTAVPLSNVQPHISQQLATTTSANSKLLVKKPDMWNLIKIVIPKIKFEWENFAYSMGYEPDTVNAIEKECNGKLEDCCKKLFQDWLTTGHGRTPKTWQTVIERIKDVDSLVAAAENISVELASGTDMSTNPSTDHEKHEQSHDVTASIGDILATEPSSDVKKHQQPQNTTASDTDLSAKPSRDHKRCEPPSHSTAGTSTKRRCL